MKQFLMLFVHRSPDAFVEKKGPNNNRVGGMSMSSSLYANAFSSSDEFLSALLPSRLNGYENLLFSSKSQKYLTTKYIPGGVEIQKYWNNTSWESSSCVGSENVVHYAARSTARHCRRCKFRYSLESCKTPTRFRQTQSEHNSCIEAMYIISCQHISGRKSIWNNRSLEGFSILSSTKGSRWIWLYKCWGWPATTTTHSKLDSIVCLLEGVKINMHCRVTLNTERSQTLCAYICWSSRFYGT